MPEESLREKMRRNRRKQNLGWTEEDELKWLQDHPEDRPEGWVDPTAVTVVHDDDLIPDIEIDETYVDTLAPYLDPVTVVDAYVRWSGKQLPADCNPDREEVQVSCPIPGHVDARPSCSINTKLGVWDCYTCQQGGDKYDIYALNRGWGPDYKSEFYNLRKAMATELGWTQPEVGFSVPDSSPSEPESVHDSPHDHPTDPTASPSTSIITKLTLVQQVDSDPNLGVACFKIDWESLIPPETFMWEWMQSTAMVDDLPHEFYFWNGLQAVAFAAGNNVWMPDQRPVKSNINVCNYGATGSGKSRASYSYVELIKRALPWTGTDYEASTGVRILPSPGSAEALLKSYVHDILDDPTNEFLYKAPVRGLLRFDEFAAFIQKATKSGLKERLIELYDVYKGWVEHYSISGGVIRAESPFCQMLTTTQPQAIHAFLSRVDVESGFMNRWIFAIGPRRKPRTAYGGSIIDLDDSVNMLRSLHDWCDTERVMPLTNDALLAWEKYFYDQVLDLVEYSNESMFSRIDLFLKKLMLIMAINERESEITADIVERTCALTPYLAGTLGVFSRDLAVSEEGECINAILKVVDKFTRDKGTSPTPRDIRMKMKGRFPDKVILTALRTASELGLIEKTLSKPVGRGRPSEKVKRPT